MDLSLKWIGKPENAIIVRTRESARREVRTVCGSGRLNWEEGHAQPPTIAGGPDQTKAKAPTSPKVGALPFSLSSHKENRWTHPKPDAETQGCENVAMNL